MATYVYASSQGQRTHSARTKNTWCAILSALLKNSAFSKPNENLFMETLVHKTRFFILKVWCLGNQIKIFIFKLLCLVNRTEVFFQKFLVSLFSNTEPIGNVGVYYFVLSIILFQVSEQNVSNIFVKDNSITLKAENSKIPKLIFTASTQPQLKWRVTK